MTNFRWNKSIIKELNTLDFSVNTKFIENKDIGVRDSINIITKVSSQIKINMLSWVFSHILLTRYNYSESY